MIFNYQDQGKIMTQKTRKEIANQSLIMLHSDELPNMHQAAASVEESGGQILHMFGPRVMIGQMSGKIQSKIKAQAEVRSITAEAVVRAPAPLSETEQLGLEAWNLRQSAEFAKAKAYRPRQGEQWDLPDIVETPDGPGLRHVGDSSVMGAPEMAFEDMSPYLIGSVAVGIIIVEGPSANLKFSAQERAKVVAEVQEGLSMLAQFEPSASITWSYDIRTISVNVQPNPALVGYEPLESLWRDPAMGQLGFSQNFQGVRDYVSSIRTNLGTRWGYVAFFTKYPIRHFAYASKPRLVMNYANDGWGVDNIDQVFAHESGHIFGCPDEYGESGCNCTNRFGFLQEVNGNCKTCAPSFVPCLMERNEKTLCNFTRVHLGWRDSDGDGTFDPVDPISNALVDVRRIARRFPAIAELMALQNKAVSSTIYESMAHESIPLFLLRRLLTSKDMNRVEEALAREENQYVEALVRKFATISRDIKAANQVMPRISEAKPKKKRLKLR
jgi:hypothetical protein